MSRDRIAVALSGGVDSAVAASLLVRQGFEVIGVHGKEWSGSWGGSCPGAANAAAARSVARHLGIPLTVISCERVYREEVLQHTLSELVAGRTPNPDTLCNRIIKFGTLARAAQKLGAVALATGHYAVRSVRNGRPELRLARDNAKDQTYFLSTLTGDQLRFARFPLGTLTKPVVRALARRYRLPVAEAPESMGLCFVGPESFRAFLRVFLPDRPGSVIAADGGTLGRHPGTHLFTIGQRHGLGLSGGPYYVAAKDPRQGTLTVVRSRLSPRLHSRSVRIRRPHWILEPPRLPIRARVRFRHQLPLVPATVEAERAGIRVRFHRPAWAVTPGQQLMVVAGRTVLGGGTMDEPRP